jgi:transketolase
MLLKECPVPFDNLGLDDCFGESGNYFLMIEKYGISAARIASAAERLLKRVGRESQSQPEDRSTIV